MTAQDKAKELFDRFYDKIEDIKVECNQYCHGGSISKKEPARQCALIAVDEIINANPYYFYPGRRVNKVEEHSTKQFWQEVRLEIEKL